MRERGSHEAFLVHHLAALELRADVTEVPFLGGLSHRQLFALLHFRKVGGAPLDAGGAEALERADIEAIAAGVLAAGEQALQRIEGEGQRLVVDLDALDGIFGFGETGWVTGR